MAKNPNPLTTEELKEIIKLETAGQTADVAENVFKKLIEVERKNWRGDVSKLIYGGFIATGLVLIALAYSTWLFMGNYQQNYLDTQASFNQQINDLRKENSDLQIRLSNDIEGVEEKQSYLERLMLGRNGE